MFCENCGNKLESNQKFCDKCGTPIQSAPESVQTNPSYPNNTIASQPPPPYQQNHQPVGSQIPARVGFSERINDPALQKLVGKRNKSTLLAAVIASFIALAGSIIAGIYKEELAFPRSLLLGGLLSAFFLIFAFSQSVKSKKDTTWDGKVVDKLSKRKRIDSGEDSRRTYTTVYVLVVQRDSDGKIFKHEFPTAAGHYNYYEIGDIVRHHKGFYLYEKYNKTYDNEVICISCTKLRNINDDFCKTCKVPLLK